MELSQENRQIFLLNLHKIIEEASQSNADHIFSGSIDENINYPPNGGLSENELSAIQQLQKNEDLRSALYKIFASTTSDVIFDLLNVIDGTSDPDSGLGDWSGIVLVDIPEDSDEDQEFLHDAFYESYWEWKKKKENIN